MDTYEYRISVSVDAEHATEADRIVDELFMFLLEHGSHAGFSVFDVEADQGNPKEEE